MCWGGISRRKISLCGLHFLLHQAQHPDDDGEPHSLAVLLLILRGTTLHKIAQMKIQHSSWNHYRRDPPAAEAGVLRGWGVQNPLFSFNFSSEIPILYLSLVKANHTHYFFTRRRRRQTARRFMDRDGLTEETLASHAFTTDVDDDDGRKAPQASSFHQYTTAPTYDRQQPQHCHTHCCCFCSCCCCCYYSMVVVMPW